MSNKEQWRPVVGWEGLYEVSDHGRVRSLDRTVVDTIGRTLRLKGKVLRPCYHKYGYPQVNLWRANKGKLSCVHKLVAAAFIGPRPEGMDVCHGDGNPTNNHVSNLRYGTRQENQADRLLHGTHQEGARNANARLTWTEVREIRAMNATGCYLQQELADVFDVSVSTISEIVNFKRWRNDPLENP